MLNTSSPGHRTRSSQVANTPSIDTYGSANTRDPPTTKYNSPNYASSPPSPDLSDRQYAKLVGWFRAKDEQ
ncbi:hypothetical protein VTH06DRAFT_4435 [Thermothelomyces fergusii]